MRKGKRQHQGEEPEVRKGKRKKRKVRERRGVLVKGYIVEKGSSEMKEEPGTGQGARRMEKGRGGKEE